MMLVKSWKSDEKLNGSNSKPTIISQDQNSRPLYFTDVLFAKIHISGSLIIVLGKPRTSLSTPC